MSLLDRGLLARWFPFLFCFRTLAIFWQRSCHTSEKLLQMLAFQWSLLRSLKGRLLLRLPETMTLTGFWDICPYRISFPSSSQGMKASAFPYGRKWKESLHLMTPSLSMFEKLMHRHVINLGLLDRYFWSSPSWPVWGWVTRKTEWTDETRPESR